MIWMEGMGKWLEIPKPRNHTHKKRRKGMLIIEKRWKMKEMEKHYLYALLPVVNCGMVWVCHVLLHYTAQNWALLSLDFFLLRFFSEGEKNNQKEKKSQRTQMIIVH